MGLGGDLDVTGDIPNKAGELTRDGHTAFVLRHLAPGVELLEPVRQAQLRLPGDVANGFGLTLLANLNRATHARVEAVRPGGLHEDAPRMFVAGLGDRPLMAAVTTGVLRRNQSQIL